MKDIQVQQMIEKERERQRYHIELIASENYVSKDVLDEAYWQINMRKDILENVTMEDVSLSMRLRI